MPITGGGAGSQLPRGVRSKYADFLADNAVMVGTSIVRRPDAISFDYLTAHTVGPVQLGVTSQGIVSWVWRARATATQVFIARENATRDGWDAETLLFNYGGVAISEMDFCFDQNGQPIVVADRADVLWIYYNDITLGGYGFRSFGPGRTPRAVLDDPLDVNGSDVLVFYVDADLGIVYRQQRERYATVYLTTDAGANPEYIPPIPLPNYGPVLIRPSAFGPAYGEIGSMGVQLSTGNTQAVDINDHSPTDRFTGAAGATIHLTQTVFGLTVEMVGHLYPQFGGGGVQVWNAGLVVAAAGFSTPTADDPIARAVINFPAGFDRIDFSRPAADHQAVFQNLKLRLSDAQLDSVKANVASHGPVLFDYTVDPTVASGTVDGVTVEVRAPLNTINGNVVDISSITYPQLSHTNTPGVFRPMAWALPESPYSWRHDLDGARIQSAPILPAQLTSGDNRNIQSSDLVLTFSTPVDGIEIEGAGTIDYANRIIAYNALGVVIASIEPTPPVAFARYTNRYSIFVPGIKTLRLVAVAGAVYPNGVSWTNLTFKKVGDLPSDGGGGVPIPPQVFPPAPIPPKTDVFIEDAVRTPDGRVTIIYSVRDAASGAYSFGRIDTVLYPYHAPVDGEFMTAYVGALSGVLHLLIADYLAPYNFEGMLGSCGLTPAGANALLDTSVIPIDQVQPYNNEGMTAFVTARSGVLFLVIHDWDQYYNLEGMTAVIGSRLGFLTQVVFDQDQPYVDEGMTAFFGVKSTGNTLA